MEPILIYGFPSGSSMGLVAALEWLGKPYRLSRVDMFGEMRDPSYARINARHETPALITDQGAALTETMAIAHWFAARDSERRISFDPLSPENDRMIQRMAFINTSFTGGFGPLWAALEMAPPNPVLQAALRDWGAKGVIEQHNRLEAMMADGPYLAGNKPTLADGLFIGVARWLDFHGVADRRAGQSFRRCATGWRPIQRSSSRRSWKAARWRPAAARSSAMWRWPRLLNDTAYEPGDAQAAYSARASLSRRPRRSHVAAPPAG